MLKEDHGDLIELARSGRFDVIVHGCNCFCVMGGGIAAQIRSVYPEAYEADRATSKGDRGKLGSYSVARIDELCVVNAYTQFSYMGGGVLADYDAIRSCMTAIAADFGGMRIGLPQIGAGLAGGDWDRIRGILEEAFADADATVVYYRPGSA